MIELSSLSYYGNPLISSLYGCITAVQLYRDSSAACLSRAKIFAKKSARRYNEIGFLMCVKRCSFPGDGAARVAPSDGNGRRHAAHRAAALGGPV